MCVFTTNAERCVVYAYSIFICGEYDETECKVILLLITQLWKRRLYDGKEMIIILGTTSINRHVLRRVPMWSLFLAHS